jgi:indole-3-glycerol phosphate synthase
VSLLETILGQKQAELPEIRARRLPAPPSRRELGLSRAPGEPLRIITEIKRRSPSAGALSTLLGVGERARAYERAGASMVSVLCDSRFFGGSFEHLAEARAACSLPLLCKEFVIDEAQLDAARAYGADAVLLIVRCLTPARVKVLVGAARARDLVPFVEVATQAEVPIALEAGADLVGVNARDLDTLKMDGASAERILSTLPTGVTRVQLSGLRTAEDVARVAASSADAALIGEALMRQDDPEPLLATLVASAGGRARP